MQLTVHVLREHSLTNPDELRKGFKKAMNNIKRRKNYNARIMDPSLNKTNEDENEVHATFR